MNYYLGYTDDPLYWDEIDRENDRERLERSWREEDEEQEEDERKEG